MFRIGGLEPAEYNHGHSPQGDTASEQRKAMESSHGETANGWPLSLLTAMQRASSGRRGSHLTTTARVDSQGFLCSQVTERVL